MSGRRVHVIGAGFSGLTLAYYLARAGVHVDVFEKTDRAGGLIGTEVLDWGFSETAANGLLQSPLVTALFHDLNLKYAKPSAAATRARYIYRDEAKKWPLTTLETLRLVRGLAVFALRRDQKLERARGRTAESWLAEIFGQASFDYLFGPGLQGVMGTSDLSAMSVADFLSRAFERVSLDGLLAPSQKEEFATYFASVGGDSESGFGDAPLRGTVAPTGGMGELISALVEKIRTLGGTVKFGEDGDWRQSHTTVLAVPAPAAALIVNESAPELARSLSQISYLPLTLANVTYAEKPTSTLVDGFGCLFAARERFNSLGVLFSSTIFARTPTYYESWILSGADLSDGALLKMIAEDRRRLLGESGAVVNVHISRWPHALPHYNLQLASVLASLPVVPGLYLTGNYLGSIGLGRILAYNQRLSQRIRLEQNL